MVSPGSIRIRNANVCSFPVSEKYTRNFLSRTLFSQKVSFYRKGKDCLDYDICYQFFVTSDSQEPKSPKSGKTDLRKATNLVNLQDGKDEESLSLKTTIEKSEKYDASSNSPKSLTILRNISLDVAPGQLVGIAGGVGSGKSTLILAILNEVIE